jgi:hypothetical protein
MWLKHKDKWALAQKVNNNIYIYDANQNQLAILGAKFAYIVKSILEKDGPSGFLRGVVPRTLKVAPACAIMISSYEMGKHFFANRKQQMESIWRKYTFIYLFIE